MTEGVVLVEYLNAHYYKVTKDPHTYFIPSVTTKLGVIDKPFLARWRGDVGNREADMRMYDAGQKGKRIHWAWSVALEGGAVIYDPWQNPVYTEEGIAKLKEDHKKVAILRTQEEMWSISKLQKQFEALEPEIIGVEETVYDLENNDAGTIDSVLWIDKGAYAVSGSKPLILSSGVYINDLKTGSYIGEDTWLQLAPYVVMYEKMHGVECAGALITHTGSTIKTGIPGLKTLLRTREELQKDYEDYRHAAKLWERNHLDDKPETFQIPSIVTIKKEKQNGIQ